MGVACWDGSAIVDVLSALASFEWRESRCVRRVEMFIQALSQYRLSFICEVKEFDFGQEAIFVCDRFYGVSDSVDDDRRFSA